MKTVPNPAAALAAAFLLITPALARQELPPLFVGAPHVIAPARTVASFPKNTFLENLALSEDGATAYVTSHEEGKVYRIGTRDGARSELARVAGKVTGIALDRRGDLLVTGAADGGKTPAVFRIAGRTGQVERLVTPKGAVFLNGITRLSGDRYLVADSYRGAIWEVNAARRTARVWAQDPLLARSDPKDTFPAVNGIRVHRGAVYASNTQRKLLLRIPLTKALTPAGKPSVWLRDVNLDDFAIEPRTGDLYATTHVYNSVVRITPGGELTVIAEAGQGVAGSTSAAFGPGGRALYVTTNGGMFLPPPGGVGPGRLVRLEVGAPKGAARP